MRVLIVDDNKSLSALLAALLQANGHEVVASREDGQGLEGAIAELKPDAVCLDFNLPGRNGLALLEALRACAPRVAVVMITGSDDPALQARAAEAGAAGFLRKPFAQAQIIEELAHVAESLRVRAESGAEAAAHRPRAVIADDNASLRQLLKHIMADAGIEVVAEAGNGKDAAAAVAMLKPDLVCLDVEMPVMGGLEALVLMQAERPGLPVMMITAVADRAMVEQAAAAGARGYILKPFKPARVQEALRQLLRTVSSRPAQSEAAQIEPAPGETAPDEAAPDEAAPDEPAQNA